MMLKRNPLENSISESHSTKRCENKYRKYLFYAFPESEIEVQNWKTEIKFTRFSYLFKNIMQI